MKNKLITRFLLARHGQTEWNSYRRLQGHLDSPLTSLGKKQALTLAKSVVGYSIDTIISSPINRAINTAVICQNHLNTKLKKNTSLVERSFGDWEGMFFDDLFDKKNFELIFNQVTDKAPPNGESGLACADRIAKGLYLMAKDFKSKTVLIITHGDAIRCFLSNLSNSLKEDAYTQYTNGYFCEVELCHQSNKFRLIDNN